MLEQIRKNILDKNLIKPGDNILIGLSGGPDSVFLFHTLRLLKDTLSFNIYASHINHMYRGVEADNDENFVRDLCSQYGVRLFVKAKNTAEYAKELKVTEEEAGRILRYGFFRENLQELGGGKIAVAHNLNDQAETVLQRLIRGTGVDGFAAMSFKSNNIIRPILNISRKDIEKYLNCNNFRFCIDKTNNEAIYGRNKIRLNLIPYLEKNFNPNIQNTLFRMSEIMAKDSIIIEKYVENEFNEILLSRNKFEIVLNLNMLNNMEDYSAGRVIRYGISQLKGNGNNIESKHIDYAIEFLRSASTGKTINLSEGIIVEISYDNFIIRKCIEKNMDFEYNDIIGRNVYVAETGKTVFCCIRTVSEFNKADGSCINVDYDKVIGHVKVRNRRNGDSMIPCGMTGRKKLKDIFIDSKIPASDRDKRLIIEDDENIIWVEGFRIHNDYKILSSTQNILSIKIMEDNSEERY